MQNIPGFGGGQPELKGKIEADAKSAGETPAKAAHASIKQALTEAFGRPVADNDLSVSRDRNKFRVVVAPTVMPPKQNMTLFGLTLPFQRPQSGAIDAAIANVNVGAKRRIFQRLFPDKRGTFHASKTFNNEEALMRFALDCRQRLGNPPANDAQADTKREADAKNTASPPQPARPPLGAPAGLPAMPAGMPAGLPGMPAGAPPRGPGAGLPGLGGMPPGGPGGLPGMPGGPGPGLSGMPN